MNCKQCNAEISDDKQFCNRSCSASFNNKNRKISDETKAKIAQAFKDKPKTKHIKYDLVVADYIENMPVLEIAKKHSVGSKTVLAIVKDAGVHRTQKSNENRICEIHNIEYKSSGKRGQLRCSMCDNERQTKATKDLKIKAVEYKGGKCERCSYNRCITALEFHHVDPSEKDFSISAFRATKQWDLVKDELDKCILVCSNCHREIHEELKLDC